MFKTLEINKVDLENKYTWMEILSENSILNT